MEKDPPLRYQSGIPDKTKKPSFSSTALGKFTIINSVLIVLLIATYLLVMFLFVSKDWTNSKNCVAPIGEFTVEPAVDASTVLTSCQDSGYDDKGTCIYTGIPTLLQASRICNQKADICSKFVYNSNSQRMKIVSLKSTPVSGSQYDNSYTRQANVTFKSSGKSSTGGQPTLQNDITVTNNGTVVPSTVNVSSYGSTSVTTN